MAAAPPIQGEQDSYITKTVYHRNIVGLLLLIKYIFIVLLWWYIDHLDNIFGEKGQKISVYIKF